MEYLENTVKYILTEEEMDILMVIIGQTSPLSRQNDNGLSRLQSENCSQIYSKWYSTKHHHNRTSGG